MKMTVPLPALILGSYLVLMAADNVPKFDIERGCRIDNAAAQGIDLAQPIANCIRDEQQAQQQLQTQWSQYSASDKANCTMETSTDGTPSYVELLTCLELARDARK